MTADGTVGLGCVKLPVAFAEASRDVVTTDTQSVKIDAITRLVVHPALSPR